ncbi:MAG: hypothetical protein IIY29_04855 [Firmicutes bacterium]|nr:hypothetical protein [Bacillota bacterium]
MIIKFILVLLLCVPLVFIMYLAVKNLVSNLNAQQRRAEQIRQKKARLKKDEMFGLRRPAEPGQRPSDPLHSREMR